MKKYYLYYNGKRINNVKNISKYQSGVIHFVEKNHILSRTWWLRIFLFDVLLGNIGSATKKEVIDPLNSFDLEYKNLEPNQFDIIVSDEGFIVKGVGEYEISNKKLGIHPFVEERIENKQYLMITVFGYMFLILFFALLVIGLII